MNYFDLHCDTACEMYKRKQLFLKNNLCISAEKGEVFDNWTQTFAIWIEDQRVNPFGYYSKCLDYLKTNLCGKVNPIFAVEGGTVIENDINRLYILKKDGIRFITLTWNGENAIAGGVKSERDLTGFGKKVINKMNELKMAVDLSHLNEKSFYSVCDSAEKVLATHSNCKSICDVARNLSDDQIKTIVKKGGIIGLNFYPQFLGGSFIESFYRNIYHLCDMGYEDNIAIGSDFDGAKMCRETSDISKMPSLFEKLMQKGFNTALLEKIFYKNADNYVANL